MIRPEKNLRSRRRQSFRRGRARTLSELCTPVGGKLVVEGDVEDGRVEHLSQAAEIKSQMGESRIGGANLVVDNQVDISSRSVVV